MSVLLFANNAKSTIAGAITNTAVTVNLAAGGGALFPNPTSGEYFVMTFVDAATGLLNEIVWCTARSTDTLTIVRGQEGTTALNWLAGDIAASLWTAGQAAQMLQQGQVASDIIYYGADTGSANAYVLASTSAPTTSYFEGMVIVFSPANGCSSASTVNVDSLGVKSLTRGDSTSLRQGDFAASQVVLAIYDGAKFQIPYITTNNSPASSAVEFTSSTTWTVPSGITILKSIQIWAGGAGGGGSFGANGAGSGGGGGEYAVAYGVPVTPGAVIAITIGAGGAAGDVTPTNGGSGGNTVFASSFSAGGGGGGYSGTNALQTSFFGAPGTGGGGGSYRQNGGNGVIAFSISGAPGGGFGGYSPMGGGPSPTINIGTTGNQGIFPGGGGNGGAAGDPAGVGAGGLMIITY